MFVPFSLPLSSELYRLTDPYCWCCWCCRLQLALQDVKDGFGGLGPISDEKDRVTLVRLYLLGLSYAMGVVPKGEKAAG